MYVGLYVVCMCVCLYARMNERKKERKRVKEKSYIVVTVYAWVDVICASTLAIKHATNVTNELFHLNISPFITLIGIIYYEFLSIEEPTENLR